MEMTEANWVKIGIKLNQKAQAKGLESLSKDESPESSPNWWIYSDCERVNISGTLDECLKVSDIHEAQINKAKKLCLKYGCVWFFTGRHEKVTFHTDAIKTNKKQDQGHNFLTLAHSPSADEYCRLEA